VELNPHAARLLEENVRLNNLTNVQAFRGDARDALKKFSKQFDRVAMPLPKSAADFLPLVLKNAAKGCVVHYYAFTHAKNAFQKVLEDLRKESRKQSVKITVLGKRVVVESAPGEVEVAVDFMIV
jgi:tRNA G37 N-methylase Trm5